MLSFPIFVVLRIHRNKRTKSSGSSPYLGVPSLTIYLYENCTEEIKSDAWTILDIGSVVGPIGNVQGFIKLYR